MAVQNPLIQVAGSVQQMPSADRVAGHVVSSTITTIITLTQTAYDALGTPDENTLYLITGA